MIKLGARKQRVGEAGVGRRRPCEPANCGTIIDILHETRVHGAAPCAAHAAG